LGDCKVKRTRATSLVQNGGLLRNNIVVLLAFVAMSFLAGCGGSSDSDYSVSSNSVSFSGVQGATPPAPQSVGLTVNSGLVYAVTAQSGECFTHSFAITGKTTGVITVYPSSCPTAGIHYGTITVTGCSTEICRYGLEGSSSQTIQVVYNVTPAPAAPLMTSSAEALEFRASSSAPPAAQTLTIGISSGSAAWTSSIEYANATTGWLNVSPSAGPTLPASVTVSGSIGSLSNGRYSANLVFTSGSSVVKVPVTLEIFDPAVNFVSPYVGRTSVEGEVIIRGHGFSSVSQGPQVLFGSTSASAVNVVNDTEIRAKYPALAAGSYPVTVKNSTVTLPSRARLVVMDRIAYPYAAIPTPNAYPSDIIYDSERRSLYLYNDYTNQRIDAYRFNGATWVMGGTFLVGNHLTDGVALSPDGTELLISMGTLQRISPSTLQTMGQAKSSVLNPKFTNDGFAFGRVGYSTDAPIYSYDMLAQQANPLNTLIDLSSRGTVASGDGSKVLFLYFNVAAGSTRPIIVYNAADQSFSTSTLSTNRLAALQMDRTGSTILVGVKEDSQPQITPTIYNGSFAALGSLPTSSDASYVLSPDGRYAYAYYTSTKLIRKFDLSAPSAGSFVEIGTGTPVADSPVVPGNGNFVRMIISPDGETLFLAGNSNIIVMPAP
jgi:hypothetical protein